MKNKGMSLIEVVVSLAILSIIVVCVCTFLQVGMNTTTTITSDATIQKEAQVVLSQIKGWIMEANQGVATYQGSGTFDLAAVLYNSGEEEEENYVQIIYFKEEQQALYYHKCMVTDSFTGTKAQIEQDANTIEQQDSWKDYLLSQYVEQFAVDTTKEEQQMIELQIDYTLQHASYTLKQTVKMRNKPVLDE